MDLIHWLQSFSSPAADTFFILVSQINTEQVMLPLLTLIFWCIDARQGWLLGNLYLFSVGVHEVLKAATNVPRPNPADVRVLAVDTAPGSSFPSGHAMDATVVFGYIPAQLRRPIIWIFVVVMVVLVSISRLYLGLHWPPDVLAGILIGVVILVIALWFIRTGLLGGLSAMGSLKRGLFVVVPLAVFALAPVGLIPSAAGVALGMNLGYLWLLSRTGGTFPVRVSLPAQALKLVIGWGGLLLLRYGLKAVFPEAVLFDFLRYVILGLWAGWLAPILFNLVLRRAPAPADQML